MSIIAHKNALMTATGGGTATGGTPTPAQLAVINTYALEPLTTESAYVRTALIAHTGIDRDGELFSDELLAELAQTLPGKGLFVKHPSGYDGSSAPGAGRWFEARVLTMSHDEARSALRSPGLRFAPDSTQAKVIEASFFLPRMTANDALLTNINAGVAGDVSVGFRASARVPLKDAAGNTLAQRLMGPGEALEASLVWLGAQPGARVTKDFDTTKGDSMDLQKQLDTLTAEHATLKAQAEANATKAAGFDALTAAIGEDLIKSPDTLKRLVAEAKHFHATLVDEIVKLDRLSGVLGDDPAEVTAAKSFMATMSTDMLSKRAAALGKRINTTGQLPGSDPNNTNAQGQPTGTGPLANPLLS